MAFDLLFRVNKMKKYLVVFFCLAALFTAGCGDSKNDNERKKENAKKNFMGDGADVVFDKKTYGL